MNTKLKNIMEKIDHFQRKSNKKKAFLKELKK